MRFRFWRDRSPDPSKAVEARQQAERDLAATKAETAKYRAFARSMIEIQVENHLGQRAAKALRGEK